MPDERIPNLLNFKNIKVRQHLGALAFGPNLRSWQCSDALVILPLSRCLAEAVNISDIYL